MLGCVPESVEESLHAAGGLLPQDLDAAFHVYFGGLGEGPHRVDVVVEDDDPDHDPQTEGHGLLAGEAAPVLRRFQHDFTHAGHRA